MLDRKPEIYCEILLGFKQKEDAVKVSEFFERIGLKDCKIHKPKYCPLTYVVIATVKYEPFWDLDDALRKMFRKVDAHFKEIKQVTDTYHCKNLISISFYKYETYPALSISGENMAKIRFLEADIDIDPYDMSD